MNTSNSPKDSDKVTTPLDFLLLLPVLLLFLLLPPFPEDQVGMRMLLSKGWPQRVVK